MTLTITLTIQTDNAAFEDHGIGPELARILQALASTVSGATDHWYFLNGQSLRDRNGNTVGTVQITD